ncbi:S10 family peptidase [Mesonia ostreae]|uniref:Carboxypeptidase n=1 Tax=Mesonia ostreae TaxID=861110 RepID=A0ABU2KL03_9FLAO|nr:carboxypeptidase [Mesonia ostreae]MDT0295410.1 carboxypeptidase [Mesonia ostreae]
MYFKSLAFLFIVFSFAVSAQEITIPIDTTIITQHTANIRGSSVEYTATTGMQPVWNSDNKAMATLHYTFYKKKVKKGKEENNRPLVISFNGGPGSASAWMHIAYTGPKILNISDEGYPMQPYGLKDNPHSILDVADILYVNPVNTGYSRTLKIDDKEPNRDLFFGINADIKYLAAWLENFVSRNNLWLSPKYLIGESYGGTRVSGLALALQEQQWMYLNGVILVSPADYLSFDADTALSSSLFLPYFTAAAWYHKALSPNLQQKELKHILPEIEEYTLDMLLPALAKGSLLPNSEKENIATQMATYTGISKKVILQHNLDLPSSVFWKELLRDKSGNTIGRLDSRYLGMDRKLAGNRPDYSPELTSWLHSFTPAINYYMREHLNFKTDLKYNMFGPVHPWDNRGNNTREHLRKAMAENPYLHILFQTGYFDGATTYFHSKYSMSQIDPSGQLKDRMHFKTYHSGHMMYLRQADLKTSNEDLREFLKQTNQENKTAKY